MASPGKATDHADKPRGWSSDRSALPLPLAVRGRVWRPGADRSRTRDLQRDRVSAPHGPWDFLSFAKYPDNETAFRVLAKIAQLEVVKTETFPAEKVDVFLKALV